MLNAYDDDDDAYICVNFSTVYNDTLVVKGLTGLKNVTYGGGIQLPLKRLPDSIISSLIQAGWRQVRKNIQSPKPCFNIPRDRQLP